MSLEREDATKEYNREQRSIQANEEAFCEEEVYKAVGSDKMRMGEVTIR